MSQGNIFFGIGAQKAGTTWLYEVLSAYPDCAPLPIKEMHFFDKKYSPDRSVRFLKEDFRQLAQLAKRVEEDVEVELQGFEGSVYQDGFLRGARIEKRMDRMVRLAERLAVTDTASYVRYIENWRKRSGNKVVGEITPAYSTLPIEGFREIESQFPEARYIFIMRDPVGRYWSQLRFWLSQRGRETDPNLALPKALKREDFAIRSDYRRTIEVLEQLVPRERIHYAFFEDLVAKDRIVGELRRLESFLGLSPLDEATALRFVEEPANVSPKTPMSAESRRVLSEMLAPTYAFVRAKFGTVPNSWAKIA